MNQVSPLELEARLNSAHPPHLLDVREEDEHELVSLPGSKLIPLGELPGRTDELDPWKHEPVVVYCHHGVRSQHAIAFLMSAGFQTLENLQGGIDAWSTTVDPTLPRYGR
tara:strand:- start:219 stop:548 length:330 start_codon:yes stop_codon:yes gene_type:complete